MTNHGRPVALLTPLPSRRPFDQLLDNGRIAVAEGDLLGLGEPLAPAHGMPLPSRALDDARAGER